MTPTWPTWRQAWHDALYGPAGFYRREQPAAHFRTSVHASPLFASALLVLARISGLSHIVDIGAGRGELLTQLHLLDRALSLTGVEVAARPAGLPAAVDWGATMPLDLVGLVVANEWLDNLPCEVVQLDKFGSARVVHVDPATGRERLGATVGAEDAAWLDCWWPLEQPGDRAEVGRVRDAAWAEVVAMVRTGLALAVDYGHLQDGRPTGGSLASYLGGRHVELRVDGSRDVTAHVALDSLVAAAPRGHLIGQRAALRALGVSAVRPSTQLARADPSAYLRRLTRAGEAVELTARGGLGSFGWVIHPKGIEVPFPGAQGQDQAVRPTASAG